MPNLLKYSFSQTSCCLLSQKLDYDFIVLISKLSKQCSCLVNVQCLLLYCLLSSLNPAQCVNFAYQPNTDLVSLRWPKHYLMLKDLFKVYHDAATTAMFCREYHITSPHITDIDALHQQNMNYVRKIKAKCKVCQNLD